jgi:GNAT superfamily N-acetyltransferase
MQKVEGSNPFSRFEVNDADLFDRSVATLVESWRYLATGSPGAELIETDGAAIAAFVRPPDSGFLNNAVLLPGPGDFGSSLQTVEHVYEERGIGHYAVWVHESESAAAIALEDRGYGYDSSTRTMAMPIADFAELDTSSLEVVDLSPSEFWRIGGPADLLPELPVDRAHFHVCRFEGKNAATLMAFDHEGDCGIYMVETVPAARRRGLASALSAHAVAEARKRGCATASLQATPMAERVYAKVGFRDLGRFEEYVPGA